MAPLLRYIVKVMMISVLMPLRLLKTKEKKVFLLNDLMGRNANYSSNPKYIANYLVENHPGEFEIVFPISKFALENTVDIPKGVKFIKPHSIKYYYHALTSEFFITTSGGISYIPFKKNQTVINSWHGGGAYKKMGLDVEKELSLEKALKITESKTDFFISSNIKFSEAIQSAFLIPNDKILNFGLPRNDIIFDKSKHEYINRKVRERYSIDTEVNIILYAPTYRTANENIFGKHFLGPYDIDYSRVVESFTKKFGGKWVFALRLHPSIANEVVDLPQDVINMSDYDDPQELYITSSVLINDYSSTMWDFCLTNKPCFIYASDLNNYDLKLGFYTQPSEWPFPLAENNDEFEQVILNFDEEKYQRDLSYYLEWMGSYENGDSIRKTVEIMLGSNN